ncbi:methionyl-tRNA formyltransferase [Candidatus Falkowbacteria bacterium RIFOXYD2_FULL_35_9]|uniref:Methionyl-tRNA formyltransferase n=1 Tax=Candidatus Falkowbacteria bacterium RIFOXYC2_FULL_36_12 TaxID=1798002 RepID=A0A1F5T0J0_9BACT|nr:MAG: methionyl-tRNA formyltransferase [Candidatus Falkowbacteria bacterium RIFOXYB2_FULL_35_7]OGF32429.1 MAG: methionyl-tRNA formyltransferase [Candidatus Falkowbacteria bacterium RIFOXYC2_FULL_36_12]OGF46778.1 MAG: methionyl-tRNA formyltransferase [Candidatus Falkowbacteria bacterium RIFOXYD2_FULL_35_9]
MEKKDIKIVFFGTSEFAVPIFKKIADNYDVKLVVTSPDKPSGRKMIMTPPPVKAEAENRGLAISQPNFLKRNDSFFEQLRKINPDIIIVVAYGKILPPEIINLPEQGCLNIHGSILPKYRGASPIQTALINGDKETGVSIILMDLGMDTGDIIKSEYLEINPADNFTVLSTKMSEMASSMIDDVIIPYITDELNLEMQDDDRASYCTKIESSMGKVIWSMSASAINNLVRAIAERVGVYTTFNDKKLNIIKSKVVSSCQNQEKYQDLPVGTVVSCMDEQNKSFIAVKCGKGALELEQVQLEGKKPMAVKDFINGQPNFVGSQLK